MIRACSCKREGEVTDVDGTSWRVIHDPACYLSVDACLSSAGTCATCGTYAAKRYGGEGRYLPECLECWAGR